LYIYSDKINDYFLSGYSCFTPSFDGNPLTQQHKILSKNYI